MKGTWHYPIILILALVFSGCSGNDGAEAEKGAIDRATDKAAETAVRKIRTPMDKASATRDLGEERLQAMEEGLKQQ